MENTALDELKAHLMATDDEFRRLSVQHTDYDRQLEALEAKHAPSEQDKIEEIRLKKLKLHLKDQMTEILGRHRAQQVA
ncbi:MAG TPA: DUF465 domain-containing protein [Bryobacteraceae bacterium]|nr:DUF465 domain-containing protein [Bryobacteraceae bacterium]